MSLLRIKVFCNSRAGTSPVVAGHFEGWESQSLLMNRVLPQGASIGCSQQGHSLRWHGAWAHVT